MSLRFKREKGKMGENEIKAKWEVMESDRDRKKLERR